MGIDARQISMIRRRLASGDGVRGALAGMPVLNTDELARIDSQLRHELVGAGKAIAPLLEDPEITDVVVNGTDGLWVDRGQGMERVDTDDPQLADEESVRALAVRLAAMCGQRLDDASPIVDGTFPSGVRLHALIPPLSAHGTLISLRTHKARVLHLDKLVRAGSVAPGFGMLATAMVKKKANAIISGATGAGKTTYLNAMLSMVSENERILIIEESAELAPEHPHVIHLQVRNANVQGAGEVTMSELVRAAMRMRPDRIVLGECRGAEVRDVLGALNTGHEGGWATIHANSAQDVPARLTALGALANMSEATVAAQAASALDVVIHVQRRGTWRGVAELGVLERRGSELFAVPAFSLETEAVRRAPDGGSMPGVGMGRSLVDHQFGRVVAGPGAEQLCERLELDVVEVIG